MLALVLIGCEVPAGSAGDQCEPGLREGRRGWRIGESEKLPLAPKLNGNMTSAWPRDVCSVSTNNFREGLNDGRRQVSI